MGVYLFKSYLIENKFDNKKYVLVITNYREKSKYYKYIKKAQKNISRSKKNIIWINVDLDKMDNNPNYVSDIRRLIKEILRRKKILAVVDGSMSKIANITIDLFPPNMPIIVDASSPEALSHFSGN